LKYIVVVVVKTFMYLSNYLFHVQILNIYFFRATNPSQFEIEFFVNDLSKPGASTFESLGGLEYKQNVNIQLECDRRVSIVLLN
jgi:hypothetical protein